jgi:hypothetical protein
MQDERQTGHIYIVLVLAAVAAFASTPWEALPPGGNCHRLVYTGSCDLCRRKVKRLNS